MCLSHIKKKYPPNDNIMMCYKVFMKLSNEHYRNRIISGKLKIPGIIQKANNVKLKCHNFPYHGMEKYYDSGYHAYTNKKDSVVCRNGEVICKVLLWDIRTIGRQHEYDYGYTVVAKNMMIMEELK